MNEKKIIHLLFSIVVILVVAISIFGVVNYKDRVAGKKEGEDIISEVQESEIMLEGTPLKIRVRTFKCKLGFKVDYDIDIFEYKYVNDELRFVFKEDDGFFVGIKRVENKGTEDQYTRYIIKNNTYFEAKINAKYNTSEYQEGIIARMNYLIDSIEVLI